MKKLNTFELFFPFEYQTYLGPDKRDKDEIKIETTLIEVRGSNYRFFIKTTSFTDGKEEYLIDYTNDIVRTQTLRGTPFEPLSRFGRAVKEGIEAYIRQRGLQL